MKRGYSAVLLCIVLLFSCGIVSGVLSEDGDDRFVEPDLNMTGGDEPSAPPKETKLFDPEDESGPLEEDDPVEISVNMNVEGEPHIPLEELGHSEHGEDELKGLHQPEEIPDSIPFFLEEMPPFEGDPLNVYSRPLYEPDSILVQFKPPVASNTILMATTSDHLNALHQTTTRLDLADYGQPGLLVINLPDDLTVPDAINRFSRHPDILFAEPNFYYYHDKIPDDPDFGLLWGLRNTGQIVGGQAGTTGADISAPGAWDITTGSTDVVIAVIDSGIYLNHYDLNQNIWRNIKEKYSGSDTDGNGYIDDVDGWNFYNENNDVTDLNGHGTHCAGTIAAIGDNGWTIAGVMWTARIMPLKFSGPHGSGTTLGAIKAINYAKENGAHIISNSWGSAGYSEALKTAIEGFDGIVVCSAGNNASNNDILPRYPSCYNSSNIISVAATDNNDALSEFSCYGANTVHVGAPGTMIYSTSILYDYEELFSDLTL
ncbi:S8 family serine peptidase [Methanocalculus taiwanensis]|uniref:S8 family serine peptidase n=1 Tax=Methanocalculus taiwanensis TaxID=106207 RepID=A0ABD4TKU2_9EURY|nr:S8 family peptidase [Methanocalculus taiwanensis]MCQ1539533.1 S8 family serine peptidase [Methanocalculus taiwanensis]